MDIMILLFLPTVDASVSVIVVRAIVGSVHWVWLVTSTLCGKCIPLDKLQSVTLKPTDKK